MIPQHKIRRCLITLFAAIYFISSLYVMLPFMVGCVGSGYTGLDNSPYGVASRPFVYRALVPAIAGVVRSAVPAFIEKPLTEKMIRWRDSEEGKKAVKAWFIRPPPLSNDRIFETAIVIFVAYLTLLAFIGMFYILARALFPDSLSYALVAPLLALQLIPALTVENGYIYDFAELFFSCACFYLLFKQKWTLYLACLAVATLNKETTIFGIFFYAIWFYSRLPRKQYVALLLQQLAIYLAIKGGVTLWFADKPGTVTTWYLPGNLAAYYAHAWLAAIGLIALAAFIAYRWREKPAFLRAGLWMLLPNMAAYMMAGIYGEYRALYWSLPVLILLATHSLIAMSGLADLRIFRPAFPPLSRAGEDWGGGA